MKSKKKEIIKKISEIYDPAILNYIYIIVLGVAKEIEEDSRKEEK